jgi:hypothetical protein
LFVHYYFPPYPPRPSKSAAAPAAAASASLIESKEGADTDDQDSADALRALQVDAVEHLITDYENGALTPADGRTVRNAQSLYESSESGAKNVRSVVSDAVHDLKDKVAIADGSAQALLAVLPEDADADADDEDDGEHEDDEEDEDIADDDAADELWSARGGVRLSAGGRIGGGRASVRGSVRGKGWRRRAPRRRPAPRRRKTVVKSKGWRRRPAPRRRKTVAKSKGWRRKRAPRRRKTVAKSKGWRRKRAPRRRKRAPRRRKTIRRRRRKTIRRKPRRRSRSTPCNVQRRLMLLKYLQPTAYGRCTSSSMLAIDNDDATDANDVLAELDDGSDRVHFRARAQVRLGGGKGWRRRSSGRVAIRARRKGWRRRRPAPRRRRRATVKSKGWRRRKATVRSKGTRRRRRRSRKRVVRRRRTIRKRRRRGGRGKCPRNAIVSIASRFSNDDQYKACLGAIRTIRDAVVEAQGRGSALQMIGSDLLLSHAAATGDVDAIDELFARVAGTDIVVDDNGDVLLAEDLAGEAEAGEGLGLDADADADAEDAERDATAEAAEAAVNGGESSSCARASTAMREAAAAKRCIAAALRRKSPAVRRAVKQLTAARRKVRRAPVVRNPAPSVSGSHTGLPNLNHMIKVDLDRDVRAHTGPLFKHFLRWIFNRYPGIGKSKLYNGNAQRHAVLTFARHFGVDAGADPHLPLWHVMGHGSPTFPTDGTTVYKAPPWEKQAFAHKNGFNPYDVHSWNENKDDKH